VLLVQLDGLLETSVGDEVAVGKVLGQDACARLLFLCDFVRVTLAAGGGAVGVVVVGRAGAAGDGKGVAVERCAVQEVGRLGRRLLLKGNVGALGGALIGDVDVGDLAAKRKDDVSIFSGIPRSVCSSPAP